MISKFYSIYQDKKFVMTVNGAAKDVQKEYVTPMQKSYNESLSHNNYMKPAKFTKTWTGVLIHAAKTFRKIMFADLILNDVEDFKTLKGNMIVCIIEENFSNDNMTFFMLERGLVTESRDELSEYGKEIQRLFFK